MRQRQENFPFPAVVIVALALWLAALRLVFQSLVPPLPDEAYYWLWGQRPALGYYDHAPLQAWLLGLSAKLLGWNLFALRVPTLLTSAALAGLLLHFGRGWSADKPGTGLLLFFASPLVFVFTSIVFHDHLMLVFVVLAAGLFARVLDKAAAGESVTLPLYGAALALGLAGLSKYNAVFLGLAFALTAALHGSYRSLFRNPHLYLAGALALILQTPVLVWNITHDFASFRYNLSDRLSGARSLGTSFGALIAFFGLSLALLSPFLWPALTRIVRGAGDNGLARLLRVLVVLTGAVLGALCFKGQVHYYWFVVALIPCFLLLPGLVSQRAARGHLIFGALGIALFVSNYAVIPFAAITGGQDSESALLYGWDEVAAGVKAKQAETGASALMATHYRTAAQLAFALKDPRVTAVSLQQGQFDIWRPDDLKGGEKVLILADEIEPLGPLQQAHFARVSPAGEIVVTRFGYVLKTYRLYTGEGYNP